MAVNSATSTPPPAPRAEPNPAPKTESRQPDNDADDQRAKPVVNTQGQTTGTIVNTKA